MSFLLALIGAVIKPLLDYFLNRKPPEPTVSQVQEKIDEVQIKAAAAGDVAARSVDTDDKLRRVEAVDPNNRDNG